jgi:hypothetical protein
VLLVDCHHRHPEVCCSPCQPWQGDVDHLKLRR